MSIENEIKETMLVLESIIKMSNVTHREALLLEFVKYFVKYNNFKLKDKIPDLTVYEDFKQFPKIAELIESEVERMEFINYLKKMWSC